MASRPRPSVQVCPLADLTLGQLRGLLAGERTAWRERLSWDLGGASDLIERAVRMGVVPGCAVTVDGRAVASLTHHAAGDLFRLCSLHVARGAPPAAVRLLVEAALASPDALDRRIEGQLFGFEHQADLDAALAAAGLTVVPREYLALDLSRHSRPRVRGASHAGSPRALRSSDLPACAEVLVAAHAGGVEARINSAFRARSLASAYLTEVSSGPGCGTVQAEASTVVTDASGRVAGFCLVTTISRGVGHVVQVAVRPESQGAGLGTAVLARAAAVLRGTEHDTLTLSVSCANERALSWYRRSGFVLRTRFCACHLDAPGRGSSRS